MNAQDDLNAAQALRGQGRHADAVALLEHIVARTPDDVQAWTALGSSNFHLNRFARARAAFERIVALVPEFAEVWTVLGNCAINQGDIAGAIAAFARVRELRPDADDMIYNYFFYLAFHPDVTRDSLARVNIEWGRDYANRITPYAHARPQGRSERRLRIGYLSYEFSAHVTSYFFEPILARHNAGRFETFVYAGNTTRDATTERLQSIAAHWRDIGNLDPAGAAARIRADDLDILVLVSSYNALHRRVMAFKAAPVQVVYHNLVSTTGIAAIDYIITEEATDPSGEADAFYAEKLVRISERNCYAPPPDCPPVIPAPSSSARAVTFGSFNNLAKITPDVAALWGRILHALPGSRLVLKNIVRMAPDDWSFVRALLERAGIASTQVDILDHVGPRSGHLAAYGAMDIALDTFPCNGGTTSCDALWMGVPIVTRSGSTFMNRQSETYLAKLGLGDLVAQSDDDYVRIALALAADPARRNRLRTGLRDAMSHALLPYDRHVRELEAAYEEMWRRYAAGLLPAAFNVQRPRD